MTEPHVLHVVTNETWGGACRIVELLSTGRQGRTDVVCGPGERLQNRLQGEGVRVTVEPRLLSKPQPVSDVRVTTTLQETIAAADPDVVHCHSTKAGALGRIAAIRAGVPTVFTVHGWGFYATSNRLFSRVIAAGERLLASRTAAVACVSKNDYRVGARRGLFDGTTARVIRNGVPPAANQSGAAPLAREIDCKGRPVVGTLGRLATQKDPLALLRVSRRLANRGVSATTALVGDGPLLSDCRTFRDRHDLDVHLLGFREDGQDLLSGFDVFVLPSRFEGFPLVVLEAMHRGVPVVAYDVGGVSEAVVEGETGYVVPQGDEKRLTDRVAELLEDPALRSSMGERGRRRAREEFTAARMRADYETVYEHVLESADE